VTTLKLERFIFDTRFAEAFDVAGSVEKLGVPLAPVADDLMEFWYDELDLRWKEGPMALGGVTTEEALFVLETFAQDRAMRVVYRGMHGVAVDGKLEHALSGPRAMLEALQRDAQAHAWTEVLAEAMTACPLGAPEMTRVAFVTSLGGISLRDVPLFSWIIAPRSAIAGSAP
jgi:hypothetical protein